MTKKSRRLVLLIAVAAATVGYFRLAAFSKRTLETVARHNNAAYGRFVRSIPGFAGRVRAAFGAFDEVLTERDLLREEAARCRVEALEADALRRENEALRRALGLAHSSPDLLFCEVLSRGDTAGWRDTIRLGKGADAGIEPGDPVFTAEGLVGRVLSTTGRTADVMPLTDANCRVACRLEAPGGVLHGILSGGGTARRRQGALTLFAVRPMTADYLDKDADVPVGTRVFTSGLGGFFPAGIPVGVVQASETDETGLYKRAAVAPAVDFEALRFCFVRMGRLAGTGTGGER